MKTSQGEVKKIQNIFLDIISLCISFFIALPRSIYLFLSPQKKNFSRNFFFDFLDFFLRIWPKYFYSKPSGIKLTSIIADFWKYLFRS